MQPCISVIIPIYNAEKYLPECLDSVCGQTFQDIEIICVNDGSTDKSTEILANYSEKDERILVISQPNAGAGAARNKGMEAASGEYLAFIDADDFWKPGLLEDAYRWVKQCSADLCLYPFAVYDEQTGTVSATEYSGWLPGKQPFRPIDYRDRLFQMAAPAPGYCLYRRQMILDNKISFLPQHIAEDIYFVFLSLAAAEKICYLKRTYAYLRRGINSNLSSALWKYPRETHHSLLMIKKRLEEAETYQTYRETFRTAAISSSEYIFWRVPTEILTEAERRKMLEELDISDKAFITAYHGSDTRQPSGKLNTFFRMVKTYGIRYTSRFVVQSLKKPDDP